MNSERYKISPMRESLVYLPTEELERLCRLETLRRSGPGGQNRNKVETGVRFYLDEAGLVGEATERRYQGENRRIALQRLRLELALKVRESILTQETNVVGEETKRETVVAPSALRDFRWFSRLVGNKIQVSAESDDYPTLVAEFFDAYQATDENLSATAEILQTTSSQIVRFLSKVPKALEALNTLRERRGLGRLRP